MRLESSELIHIGRLDDQLKISGYRVEPGEIEALLRRCPWVDEAVVVARQRHGSTELGVVYRSAWPLDGVLEATARRELPSYMIPTRFVRVDALPTSHNGKLDPDRAAHLLDAIRHRPMGASGDPPIVSGADGSRCHAGHGRPGHARQSFAAGAPPHRGQPGRDGLPGPACNGGTPDDLLSLARILDPTGTILALGGTVFERGAARWFRRHADGSFDVDDVVARTHELAEFVAGAANRYDLTGRRVIAIGFSNGADIAAALILLRPDVVREAVLFGAMLPVPDPPRHDLTGSRVFMAIGDDYPIASRQSADRLLAALSDRSARTTVFRHSGGHKITVPACRAAKLWARRGGPGAEDR